VDTRAHNLTKTSLAQKLFKWAVVRPVRHFCAVPPTPLGCVCFTIGIHLSLLRVVCRTVQKKQPTGPPLDPHERETRVCAASTPCFPRSRGCLTYLVSFSLLIQRQLQAEAAEQRSKRFQQVDRPVCRDFVQTFRLFAGFIPSETIDTYAQGGSARKSGGA
jgi:hypothetical protein